MDKRLKDIKVAILATDGFEQSELLEPRKALLEEGAEVHVISPKSGSIRGWSKTDWGEDVKVDKELNSLSPEDYDALVLPGGVMNPDSLRINDEAIAFIRKIGESGKPIAAICHAPWTLIEAGLVKGRKLTSYPTLRTDLINAGADWVDEEVVTDNGMVTSRKPADLPAFCDKMIEEIAEGRHQRRQSTTKSEEARP